MCGGGKYTEELRVPGSKRCIEANCSREQRVLKSKVFSGAKGSSESSTPLVLKSKEFQGGKDIEE